MIDEEERLIFFKEIELLLHEYKNCRDGDIQKSICSDILLICGALAEE
ncbi:hypothetical protein [Peribacillus kribbensis]|nr:hypothetical protein [Peribacillus kribbensis]